MKQTVFKYAVKRVYGYDNKTEKVGLTFEEALDYARQLAKEHPEEEYYVDPYKVPNE